MIRGILVLLMLLFIWFYLFIFVQEIYKKYGDNIVKICILPVVSRMGIALLITANIMAFISTVLMYFIGKRMYMQTKISITKIVFQALVPPLCIFHHQSIIYFQEISKEFEKIKN